MRNDRFAVWIAILLIGCRAPHPEVFVDLKEVMRNTPPAEPPLSLPAPPRPMAFRNFSLPARPRRVLENSSSPEVLRTQADADAAQAAAMKTIATRLTKIYQKQIDAFAAREESQMGTLQATRIQQALPQLYSAFRDYAERRLPLISRLSYLAGVPDSNPKNLPPPITLRPVPRDRWVEANTIRTQIEAMDAGYDARAKSILSAAANLAGQDEQAVLQRIAQYRMDLMDRALKEATNPLRTRRRPVTLRFNASPEIILPGTPADSVSLGPTPTLPASPRVELERSAEREAVAKEMVRRQLAIWAAVHGFQLAPSQGWGVRDATKDFERWRSQQKVGP